LLQTLRDLFPEKQKEALDFFDFLKKGTERVSRA